MKNNEGESSPVAERVTVPQISIKEERQIYMALLDSAHLTDADRQVLHDLSVRFAIAAVPNDPHDTQARQRIIRHIVEGFQPYKPESTEYLGITVETDNDAIYVRANGLRIHDKQLEQLYQYTNPQIIAPIDASPASVEGADMLLGSQVPVFEALPTLTEELRLLTAPLRAIGGKVLEFVGKGK